MFDDRYKIHVLNYSNPYLYMDTLVMVLVTVSVEVSGGFGRRVRDTKIK